MLYCFCQYDSGQLFILPVEYAIHSPSDNDVLTSFWVTILLLLCFLKPDPCMTKAPQYGEHIPWSTVSKPGRHANQWGTRTPLWECCWNCWEKWTSVSLSTTEWASQATGPPLHFHTWKVNLPVLPAGWKANLEMERKRLLSARQDQALPVTRLHLNKVMSTAMTKAKSFLLLAIQRIPGMKLHDCSDWKHNLKATFSR